MQLSPAALTSRNGSHRRKRRRACAAQLHTTLHPLAGRACAPCAGTHLSPVYCVLLRNHFVRHCRVREHHKPKPPRPARVPVIGNERLLQAAPKGGVSRGLQAPPRTRVPARRLEGPQRCQGCPPLLRRPAPHLDGPKVLKVAPQLLVCGQEGGTVSPSDQRASVGAPSARPGDTHRSFPTTGPR